MKSCIFFSVILALASCGGSTKKNIEGSEGLPAIDIVTSAGDSIKVDHLDGRLILVLYNPDCDHCQRQATDISNHFDLFEGYKLYFVSAEQRGDFAEKYNLNNRSNVIFAQGAIVPVVKTLKPTSMPTILIYDDDGVLVKRFDGETKVADMAEFL